MIKVELELKDVDYDSLIDQFLPVMIDKLRQSDNPVSRLVSKGMPSSMTKMILKKLPKAAKEQMTADLINSNKVQIAEFLKDIAGQNNVRLNLGDLRAKAITDSL